MPYRTHKRPDGGLGTQHAEARSRVVCFVAKAQGVCASDAYHLDPNIAHLPILILLEVSTPGLRASVAFETHAPMHLCRC